MSDSVSRLPEDLEATPPGPELGGLLASVDRAGLNEPDRLRLARARNRQVSHEQAELMADIYAVCVDEPPDGGEMDPQQASRYPWAEVELAFVLRWTRVAAGGRLEQARQLIEDLPAVQAALRAGSIDMPKALVLSELAGWLDDLETARAVVDKVLDKAAQLTTGELRARLRKLVLAIDPDAARKRCATAVKTRRVESFDNPDGTGELWGRSLPPQDTAAAWERLTAIARSAKTSGDSRTMDQLRADALLDLLVGEGIAVGEGLSCHTAGLSDAERPAAEPAAGPAAEPAAGLYAEPAAEPAGGAGWDPQWPAEPPPERIGPHDVWPDPTGEPVDYWDAAGHAFDGPQLWPPDWPGRWFDDPAVAAAGGHPAVAARPEVAAQPEVAARRGVVDLQVPLTTLLRLAEMPGELAGWGPVVADIARQIAEQQRDGTWRFSVYNELGELGWHGITRKRPTAETAAFVRVRDHTCVAPGCRRPARACDLDHTIDKAWGGHCGASNMGCLCRLHHRFKHESGAALIQLTPGVFGWTTPRGLQYVCQPDRPLIDDDELV